MCFGSAGPSWLSGLSPAVPGGLLPSVGARASLAVHCPLWGPQASRTVVRGLQSLASIAVHLPPNPVVILFPFSKNGVVHPLPETRDLGAVLSFPISQLPRPHPSPRPSKPVQLVLRVLLTARSCSWESRAFRWPSGRLRFPFQLDHLGSLVQTLPGLPPCSRGVVSTLLTVTWPLLSLSAPPLTTPPSPGSRLALSVSQRPCTHEGVSRVL